MTTDQQITELVAYAKELREALCESTDFVNQHSETWYLSGQRLLSKCKAALSLPLPELMVDKSTFK